MSLFSKLLAIATAMCLIALILLVLFGQITVRRLRKNPATRSELGIEFASGWDILNVAEALTVPRSFTRKIRSSPKVAWMQTDADLLYLHTNLFDRILARIFFLLFIVSNFGLITLVILEQCGVFD